MAIKKRNQMEWALGTTALSLQADADESILVRGIYSAGSTAAHLTVTVGQRTVGDFRVAGALGNHIGWPPGFSSVGPVTGVNIFDKLYAEGLHRGFPVGSGQTMNWSGPNTSASINAVLYDIYDRDDIKATMPNGSESKELDYLIYGNTGATITTATTSNYDTMVSPAEFDAFPFGADVPGRTQVTCYGVLGSTFAPSENDATNDIATTYLKFTRNQTVLFDKDTTGLIFYQNLGTQSADQVGAGSSIVGNFSDTDQRLPLMFPDPLVFEAGEELTVGVTTHIAGSGANYLIADQELALIMRGVRS
jgi:hypothetical protein